MKVAIITDTHFGARGDSIQHHDHFELFYKNVFFPYLKDHNITTIIHGGDMFDKRKNINTYSLRRCKEYFMVDAWRFNTYTIVGNHDSYYKNTLNINSTDMLFNNDSTIIASSPVEYIIGSNNVKICMIPWICEDNYDECITLINSTDAKICIGHFEISGFSMYKGVECHDGMDAKLFKKFKLVLSGHYHHRSTIGNITYLGTPYEITWQDCNDQKGFHILDTDTLELQFIENPHSLHSKIVYSELLDVNSLDVKDKFVKLMVSDRGDNKKFDKFVANLSDKECYDLKIIDEAIDFTPNEDYNVDDFKDTLSMISSHIDSVDVSCDKSKLKMLIQSVYNESLTIGSNNE